MQLFFECESNDVDTKLCGGRFQDCSNNASFHSNKWPDLAAVISHQMVDTGTLLFPLIKTLLHDLF